MPPVLELEGVGVRFGSRPELLSDIGLVLRPGEVAVVSGARDAGKSLLLRVSALDHGASRGHVRLLGEPANRRPAPLRRRIGWAEAEPRLIEGLDAVDNVALPLRLGGMARAEARTRAGELLAWLGDDAPPAGGDQHGQARVVGLARAIVGAPALVLVDDIQRLDRRALRRLPTLIARLRDGGTALLLIDGGATPTCDLPGAVRLRLAGGRLGPVDGPAAAPHTRTG